MVATVVVTVVHPTTITNCCFLLHANEWYILREEEHSVESPHAITDYDFSYERRQVKKQPDNIRVHEFFVSGNNDTDHERNRTDVGDIGARDPLVGNCTSYVAIALDPSRLGSSYVIRARRGIGFVCLDVVRLRLSDGHAAA